MENFDFTTMSLIAASLAALICSYLGMYVVLRKVTFVGIALAQLATAGIALSGLLAIPCTAGAALVMLLGVVFFAGEPGRRRLPSDAVIGAAYALGGAAAVLLIAVCPHSDSDMLSLLFGNILGVSPQDIYLMGGTFLSIFLAYSLFSKQFMLISFDPMMAQSLGYNVKVWNFWFYLAVGTAIAVAIHTAGILLVFALLVLPPLTGLCLCRNWNAAMAISLSSALMAVAGGVWLSVTYDLPTGAAIVGVACLLLAVSLAIGKIRTIMQA